MQQQRRQTASVQLTAGISHAIIDSRLHRLRLLVGRQGAKSIQLGDDLNP